MSERPDFQPVGHSGGTITIHVGPDAQGRHGYQITWQHQRPVGAAMFGVYALPQGIVLDQADLGGIGSPTVQPVVPGGCFLVFVGSDSEGLFGRQCPSCEGYWRSPVHAAFCPYCGLRARLVDFMTPGQQSYVAQVCAKMRDALDSEIDGDHIIDMDAVADAVGETTQKPAFYYAEQSQQTKFTCKQCGSLSDTLGRFAYCAVCRTRNDFQELDSKTIPALRDRINAGGPYESCVRDAVSEFDSYVGILVVQVLQYIPMTPSRRNRLKNRRFHNLACVADDLKEILGIEILEGLINAEIEFAKLMFARRHVYEHKGGEADDKYIEDSGDNAVRPKQLLRETKESAHQLVNIVLTMAFNLNRGFHEIFPPERAAVQFRRRS